MITTIAVALGVLWLWGVVVFIERTVDAWGSRGGILWAAAGLLFFSVPVSFVIDAARDELGGDATALCARGHQEYVAAHTPPVLVGKIIVPGSTSTRKRWVCEQWQAEQ